ncbi:MAG: hypothetical protein KDK23_04980 [Leptospiraceae bacterium]|nr:hypothetical protein [Leptospiraceae bacterium]
MKGARSYFFKLLFAVLAAQGIRAVWHLAEPLRIPLWIAAGALFLLWILPHPGYPIFWIWKKYKDATSQGLRFFHGLALFLLAVAIYQQSFVESGFAAFSVQEPFFSGNARYWAGAGLLATIVGCIPPLAEILFGFWMKLAHSLSAVMSRVLLTIIYLISVIPVAIVASIFRKKFLVRRPDASLNSYWIERSQDFPAKESYDRMF